MDPITAALVAAVAAGVLKVGEQAVVDAYNGLKALIRRKFGDGASVTKAVGEVEQDPTSEGRRMVLAEKVAEAKAAEDPELVAAAQALLAQVRALPGGEHVVQQVSGGSNIAQAASGGTATVNVNQPPGQS